MFPNENCCEIRTNIRQLPVSYPVLGYLFTVEDEMILLINPLLKKQGVSIPEGEWAVLADHDQAEISSKRSFVWWGSYC